MPFLASHVSQTVSIPFYSPRFVPRFDILPRHRSSQASSPKFVLMPPLPILSQYVRRAMATDFVVMIPGDIDGNAEHAFAALQIAESLENLLSIYRPDSDIIRLNQAAGSHPVPLAPETFAVLDLAQRLSQMTDGAFDVTAGPLVEVWGFTKRNGSKPTDTALQAARELVGYERLKLDHQTGTAMLDRASMSVNLGAIGKGFAIDRMAAELHRRGVNHFLIHGGNSSVMAAGDDVPGSDEGWRVAIEHPILKNTRLGGLRLRNRSLGTSGSGKQFFHFKGKRYGHVIDPRTGEPAGDLLSLTILAESATVADALATGLFVMGEQAALEWVQSQRISQIDDPATTAQPNSAAIGPVGLVSIRGTGRQAEVMLKTEGVAPEDWITVDQPEE